MLSVVRAFRTHAAAWLAAALRNPHAAWEHQFAARQPDKARATQVLMQMRDWPKRERLRWAAQPLVFAPAPARNRSGPPASPPNAKALHAIRSGP